MQPICENTFLKLWSYTNTLNENRDELCDLLAVFENHIFVFFDQEITTPFPITIDIEKAIVHKNHGESVSIKRDKAVKDTNSK